MNDFDELLAELAPLAKAMEAPEGDDKVAAAAKEGGAQMPEADDEEAEEGKPGGKPDDKREGKADEVGDDEFMGKSFPVTMADGSVQEAYDGTEMMKAMSVRLTDVTAHADELGAELDGTRGELTKALAASAGLLGIVKQQGALLKSLQADVARFGGGGAGRKASLTLHAKEAGPAAPAAPPTGPSIMTKAMSAYDAGKLTGGDIARLESHLGRGNPVPDDIAERL